MIRKKYHHNDYIVVFGDIIYCQGQCWSNEVGANPFVDCGETLINPLWKTMFTADEISENKTLYPTEDRELITSFQKIDHMKAVGCGTKNMDTVNHLLKIGNISTKRLIAHYNSNLPIDIQLKLARSDIQEIRSDLACNTNLCVEAMHILAKDDYELTRRNLARIRRNVPIPNSLMELFADDEDDIKRILYYKDNTPQYILEYLHCHNTFKNYDKSHFHPALLKILSLEQSFAFNY